MRLIFLKERLAEIPAGVGWQGLSNIYYESIASRSPGETRMRVMLPEAPWLDVAMGTIEPDAMTFRVGIKDAGAEGEETELLSRELTEPEKWETARIDLDEYAGREVEITFSLEAGRDGAIGFWGSPVVRSGRGPEIASAGTDAAEAETADRVIPPNVIVIMADTLRQDHLSAYGYERDTTPTLARLASEGVVFQDCQSQATWTKVSTPSIVTGLYPTSHTVEQMTDRLPSSANTLAELYREAGYATLGFSSVPFTGQSSNMHQGYEQFHESASLKGKKRSKTAVEYVERLMPWLDDHKDSPFFVFLHVFDPHDPYEPYEPHNTMWADAEGKRNIRKR